MNEESKTASSLESLSGRSSETQTPGEQEFDDMRRYADYEISHSVSSHLGNIKVAIIYMVGLMGGVALLFLFLVIVWCAYENTIAMAGDIEKMKAFLVSVKDFGVTIAGTIFTVVVVRAAVKKAIN